MTIRLARLPVLLLCIATWMLAHPYQGIFHDANLYTLQALARLHPDTLASDVFLRFGSQDRFTIFSPIYAFAIRLLGLEHAAALLTLMSQITLFAAGWCMARSVLPATHALLGVALLIAISGDYGPARIFTCVEPFLTPRMAAEALVLAALAAVFSRRTRLGIGLLVAAFALHPVMAMAGAMAWLTVPMLPQPRRGIALLSVAIVCMLLAAGVMPGGEWGTMNADWLAIVSQRSPYLFLSSWGLDDWSRAFVCLTILIVGSLCLESGARVLCRASAVTISLGILLTGLACDMLHLTLFTQMQPWRWQWLGTLVAALVLPAMTVANWERGATARSTALLSIAAWIFGSGEYAVICAGVALGSLCLGRLNKREQRLLFLGSCAVVALAVTWRIATNLEFTDVHYMDAALPLWLRRATSFVHDGFAPAALLCLAAWCISASRRAIAASICSLLGIAVIVALFPYAYSGWTKEEYPQQQVARFAPWRNLIAARAEFFWAESPLSIWVLLNRPSYISALQTSGMIFSSESALELRRRALALSDYVGPASFLSWSGAGAHLSLPTEALQGICRSGAVGYLVTNEDLGTQQPIAVLDRLKLYACAPQARAAAAAT